MTYLDRMADGASFAADAAAWTLGALIILATIALLVLSIVWIVATVYVTASTKLEVARINRRTRQGA